MAVATSRTARIGLARAALVLAVAVAGCRRESAPQPVAPEPAPAPAVVPDVVHEPTPLAPTVDSWTPLLRLVPRAGVVAGADLGKVRQSALWAEQVDRAVKNFDAESKMRVEAAGTCGVSVRDVRRVAVATDVNAGKGVLLAVEAPRIGETATLDCLMRLTKTQAEWRGGSLVLDGGKGMVVSQGADVVVMVDETWRPVVEEALASDRATPDPEIAVLLDRVDLSAGAWIVGVVPPSSGGPFSHVQKVAVTFDTTFGLTMAAWLGIEPAHVEKVRDEMQSGLATAMSMLPAMGVPEGIMRSISFTSVGDGVVVHMRASEDDVRQTIQAIEKAVSPTHQP